jgi:hypothetical protein
MGAIGVLEDSCDVVNALVIPYIGYSEAEDGWWCEDDIMWECWGKTESFEGGFE